MRIALVLGGAACLHDDLAAYAGPFDGVVACNDAITEWHGDLAAAVSLHPRYMMTGPSWLLHREEAGCTPPAAVYGHASAREPLPVGTIRTPLEFPGQGAGQSGSSGLFAAKVALMDLGFDRAILCGVPMTPTPHIDGAKNWCARRSPCEGFRRAWLDVAEEYRARMRSVSGWTRVLLGAPETAKETV